jgi:Ser/Thr protein kinase RdoA (MazF antagonist)
MSPTPPAPDLTSESVAQNVLRRFRGTPANPGITSLQNHGGFSGARLWRVEGGLGRLCLRAWPPEQGSAEHLAFIHSLMKRARDERLFFVPAVHPTTEGASFLLFAGRFWELTDWMPGKADFHIAPSSSRLAQACEALAKLHLTWNRAPPQSGPCPAIKRRLERCRQWFELVGSGWRPTFISTLDPVAESALHAWRILGIWASRVPRLLEPWADRVFPLQPCLCDIWHDHVLYEGERVSGVIDYGSLKEDHVAVDLARLLGSLVGDHVGMWAEGLRAYRTFRPLTAEEGALAHVLDRTGTVLALANWLKWLYLEGRVYDDRREVARRLEALVARAERWALA